MQDKYTYDELKAIIQEKESLHYNEMKPLKDDLESRKEYIDENINKELPDINKELPDIIKERSKGSLLDQVINSIENIEYYEGEVDTRRTPVPFYGLKVTIDKKEYTVMYQSDCDYAFTLYSYCLGDSKRGAFDDTIYNVEYEICEEISYCNNILKLEDIINDKFDMFDYNNICIQIITALFCSQYI